jgi:hypothetical protein
MLLMSYARENPIVFTRQEPFMCMVSNFGSKGMTAYPRNLWCMPLQMIRRISKKDNAPRPLGVLCKITVITEQEQLAMETHMMQKVAIFFRSQQ